MKKRILFWLYVILTSPLMCAGFIAGIITASVYAGFQASGNFVEWVAE